MDKLNIAKLCFNIVVAKIKFNGKAFVAVYDFKITAAFNACAFDFFKNQRIFSAFIYKRFIAERFFYNKLCRVCTFVKRIDDFCFNIMFFKIDLAVILIKSVSIVAVKYPKLKVFGVINFIAAVV